jgi:hypothetical protein
VAFKTLQVSWSQAKHTHSPNPKKMVFLEDKIKSSRDALTTSKKDHT